jgi:pseudaminic acid synthase
MIKLNSKISFSYKNSPLIISEISGNHNQNKKNFLKLIESAFKNGSDLVKIQTYEPKDITINSKKKSFLIKKGIWKKKYLWDLYKKAHTPYAWHKDAFKIARKYNGILFSSPFSKRGVDFLEKLKVKIYKIASFEITDLKLIDYIASKKKPIIISTGNAEIDEIKKAIKIIKKYHNQIIILHCISSYPTLIENTNLKKILELKKIFKHNLIGLSDHTNSIFSSIAAISHGIVAIEKHYKLNDKTKTVDSSFSITPSELKTLSQIKDKIFKSLNENKKTHIDKESIKLIRSIFEIK